MTVGGSKRKVGGAKLIVCRGVDSRRSKVDSKRRKLDKRRSKVDSMQKRRQ